MLMSNCLSGVSFLCLQQVRLVSRKIFADCYSNCNSVKVLKKNISKLVNDRNIPDSVFPNPAGAGFENQHKTTSDIRAGLSLIISHMIHSALSTININPKVTCSKSF